MSVIAEPGIPTAVRCAIFKIDLKGRLVYIDDETEELLGASRDELFGKSLLQFVSPECHHHLTRLLTRPRRHDLGCEALPLVIRANGRVPARFRAVVSLNFVGGTVANYQFILLPELPDIPASESGYERRFLELLGSESDVIDYDMMAGIFAAAGGFASVACYLPDDFGRLVSVGAYPRGDQGGSAPTHVQACWARQQAQTSIDQNGNGACEDIHDRREETTLVLDLDGQRRLMVHGRRPAGCDAAAESQANLALLTRLWRGRCRRPQPDSSVGDQLCLAGRLGDVLRIGLAVVDDAFDIVYRNEAVSRLINVEVSSEAANLRELWSGLKLRRSDGEPIPFQHSSLARAIYHREFVSARYTVVATDRPLVIAGGPLRLDAATLTVFAFLPDSDADDTADPGSTAARRLIHALAHDLRAPIITMEAFARRLNTDHIGPDDEKGRFAVSCLIENAHILRKMVDGLGDLAGNWELSQVAEKVSVRNVVADLVTMLQASYPNGAYDVRLDEVFPEITIPKGKLIQLFRNLLDNAFKYSAASEHPCIHIGYRSDGGFLHFTVTDNGLGIDPRYSQRVFEPFFRAPDAGILDIPGTGMGLAIARDIVVGWGGTIRHDASQAPGTTIVCSLPQQIRGQR